MVATCVVYGCNNKHDKNVNRSFHRFPAIRTREGQQTEEFSRERRSLWIARIGRKDFTPSQYSLICSDHFVQGKPSDLYDRSNPDWAPSLKLRGNEEMAKTPTSVKRFNRLKSRKSNNEKQSVARALLDLSKDVYADNSVETSQDSDNSDPNRNPCQFFTAGSFGDKETCESDSENAKDLFTKTVQECQRLTTENFELRDKLSANDLNMDSFRDNDKKVSYYTGLPKFVTLLALFQFLEPFIPESISLTKFQKLLLVLMKLRLNLPLQDMAYRFGISQATASRIFLSMIHVMYGRLKDLVYWPDREYLQKTMPMEFRKYFGVKIAVIIDCFEIFIERPSGLLARAKTWSSYKHHNTVKYLIGVTPQGSVSFISSGWGGRASDKYITEHSGILNKLVPGDIVLADRGFDIAENVGVMCAEVKIPNFTKGKSQLPALEVERSRNIAHLRIHVERVIGLIRNKYTILQGTLPIDYLLDSEIENDIPVVDKIVTVCCALGNLCESVVPFN